MFSSISRPLEYLGCGVLIFDEALKVGYANGRAGDLFGIVADAILHRPLSEIDAMFRNLQGCEIAADERPLAQVVSRQEKLVGRELILKRPDGTIRVVSLNAAPLVENGTVKGVVADFNDISDVKKAEAERLQSEERLERYIGAMDEIAFEFDHQGRYLRVWSGDENLLKRPRRELLGKRIDEVIPQELAKKVFSAFRRIHATGKPETLEYSMEVLGGVRWFLARLALVPPTGQGEPTFSFHARDITRLKEMEQSLQDSQRRLRGLFNNAASGMAMVGLDGRCLEANPCLCEILGYSLEELRRKPFAEYSHPDDLSTDLQQFERLVRGEISSYRLEKCFIRKDKKEIWGFLTVALQRDEEGKPLYTIAVLENITQRKRVEAEKDRLLSQLEAIFASAAEGIIFHDENGRILRANPAAEEITGLSEEDKDRDLAELYEISTPRRPDACAIPIRETPLYRALHGVRQKSEIVQFQRPDGKQVWISFSGTPIFDAERHQIGTVSTFADITRLRELQERLENYLHMLAHELRTPLTVISGHAQILQAALQGSPLEERIESTRAVLSASDQMEQMMEDLVDFGRMESGQLTLHFDLIYLRDFIADFLDRQKISDDYRRVRVQVPAETPPVRIGVHHLERILGNLLSNALKYSGAEQPVDVEVFRAEGHVCLAVQDHGIGIIPENLPHIFERFYRTSRGRQKATGTGLGLYITKILIESYGGKIQVESEPEKGARFTICIPEQG